MTTQVIDLSHALTAGMHTHPGLPGPECQPYRTREASRTSTGTTFQIDRVCMVGNTGAYLDNPYHRYADGDDRWGQEEYGHDAPCVTASTAAWLAERRPALVGITR